MFFHVIDLFQKNNDNFMKSMRFVYKYKQIKTYKLKKI